MTCDKCKHWESRHGIVGTCQSPQLVYLDGKTPWLNRESGASHESHRGFWTAPKFGCVHFTQKEEG